LGWGLPRDLTPARGDATIQSARTYSCPHLIPLKVVLYETKHLTEPGFFRYLFRALRRCGSDVRIVEERPLPQALSSRGPHDGAWAELDGSLVFFDMSDHVFEYDWKAISHADFYFKANLNRSFQDRLFAEKGMQEFGGKIQAFAFFAPSLEKCARYRRVGGWIGGYRKNRPVRLFHAVGVYENLVSRGLPNPFFDEQKTLEPSVMHFWIRWNFFNELKNLSLPVETRLVSRHNPGIEDGENVFPNLNHWVFLWKMLRSTYTVLNTFPHSVYPWKAFESLALGRPFIVEREPLIEIPEAFRPVEDHHYLAVLPGCGDFDSEAPVDNPRSYRILGTPTKEEWETGFERLSHKLEDESLVLFMAEESVRFAKERLHPEFLVNWLRETIGRLAVRG